MEKSLENEGAAVLDDPGSLATSAEQILGLDKNKENENLVFGNLRKKLSESHVGSLVKVLLSHPETRQKIYHLLEDSRKLFQDTESAYPDYRKRVRNFVTGIMRDKEFGRKLFVDEAMRTLLDKSDDLRQKIRDSAVEGTHGDSFEKIAVYDEVVIGAGVHSSIYNLKRSNANPKIKSLTIEESNYVSANFSTIGEMIRINTFNRAQPDEATLDANAMNLNYFGQDAIVRVPDIEAVAYPTAKTLADVSLLNQFFSNNEFMFGSRVQNVTYMGSVGLARYRISLSDGFEVFADRIIVTTGLGKPSIPGLDEQSYELMDKIKQEEVDTADPTPIMTYEDFARYVSIADTPLRPFAGKKVHIIGGGDSGSTVMEFLLGLGPAESYAHSISQEQKKLGRPSLTWGRQPVRNEEEFYDNNPGRYVDLGPRFDEFKTIPFRVRKIRLSPDTSRGRFEITYTSDEEDETKRQVDTQYADFIIFATGYEQSELGRIMAGCGLDITDAKGGNPFTSQKSCEIVRGDFAGHDISLGKKLSNHEIYAIGPASGLAIPQKEYEISHANPRKLSSRAYNIALPGRGPRSEAMATTLSEIQDRNYLRPDLDFQPEILEMGADSVININKIEPRTRLQGHLLELQIQSVLGDVMQHFRFMNQTLELSIQRSDDDRGIIIKVFPGLTPESLEKLKNYIYKIHDLSELFCSYTDPKNVWSSLKIIVPFNGERADISSINLIKQRRKNLRI